MNVRSSTRRILFFWLALTTGLPLIISGELPRLRLAWKLVPGELPPDMVWDAGSLISSVAYTSPTGASRVGIRAEVRAGNVRSEFEWRPEEQERGSFQHFNGEDLWVGFRMWVQKSGTEQNTSYFQVGPIRHREYSTDSIGYYQLQLRGQSDRPAPLLWRWREFEGLSWKKGVPIPGAPARIVNPTGASGFLTPLRFPARTDGAPRDAFSQSQEDIWVVHLRMRNDPSAFIRLWRNGELVVDSTTDGRPLPPSADQRNALETDFTRVKWGPYSRGATADKIAIYSDIRIAQGGDGDGYRWVVPAEVLPMEPGQSWSRSFKLEPGASAARVTGLPFGWSYHPEKLKIIGTGSELAAGARILIEHLNTDKQVIKLTIWALPGDPAAFTSDQDNDGVSNLDEMVGGSDPRSASSRPAP